MNGWHPIALAVAWLVCLLAIAGGAFMVFSYALEFGNDKTYQWMVAMLSSFFADVIIVQPIKILLLTALIAWCLRRPKFDDNHVESDEVAPTLYYDPDDPEISEWELYRE